MFFFTYFWFDEREKTLPLYSAWFTIGRRSRLFTTAAICTYFPMLFVIHVGRYINILYGCNSLKLLKIG